MTEIWAAIDGLVGDPNRQMIVRDPDDTGVVEIGEGIGGRYCDVNAYRKATTRWGTKPSLWTQLLGMVATGGESAGGQGKPGSRPPVAVSALHLKMEAEGMVFGAADQLTKLGDPVTLTGLMDLDIRAVASEIVRRPDFHDWLPTMTSKIKDWSQRINAMLDPERDNRNERRRGIWCIECGSRHVTVENDDGEPCKSSPIVFQWRGGLLRAAVCEACAFTYFAGEDVHRLAEGQAKSA